jgi:hypothetical protein
MSKQLSVCTKGRSQEIFQIHAVDLQKALLALSATILDIPKGNTFHIPLLCAVVLGS